MNFFLCLYPRRGVNGLHLPGEQVLDQRLDLLVGVPGRLQLGPDLIEAAVPDIRLQAGPLRLGVDLHGQYTRKHRQKPRWLVDGRPLQVALHALVAGGDRLEPDRLVLSVELLDPLDEANLLRGLQDQVPQILGNVVGLARRAASASRSRVALLEWSTWSRHVA